MSDAAVREALREAQRIDDGPSWSRAALEQARHGLDDEAGHSAALALISDGDPSLALDALVPDLDAFEAVTLGARGERLKGNHAAWSPDSATVFTAHLTAYPEWREDNDPAHLWPPGKLVRWDTREGRATDHWQAPNRIVVTAFTPAGDATVVGVIRRDESSVVLAEVDRRTGAERGLQHNVKRGVRSLVVTRDCVIAATDRSVCALDWSILHGLAPPFEGRAYRWGPSGRWGVSGWQVRLGTSGASVIAASEPDRPMPRDWWPRDWRVHDRTGTLIRELSTPVPNMDVVVVGRRLLLHGRGSRGPLLLTDFAGAELAHHQVPTEGGFELAAAAPSGRQLALVGNVKVKLMDLGTGRSRVFDTAWSLSRENVAWSPSGRALAIAERTGQLTVISAAR